MGDQVSTTGATKMAEIAAARAVEATRERSTPGPIVMALLSAALGMAVPLVAGAVGYGEIKARLAALEERMDRTDAAAEKSLGKIEARLDQMTTKLENIQSAVQRIEARDERRPR